MPLLHIHLVLFSTVFILCSSRDDVNMIRGIMEEFKGSVGDGYIDFFSVLSL